MYRYLLIVNVIMKIPHTVIPEIFLHCSVKVIVVYLYVELHFRRDVWVILLVYCILGENHTESPLYGRPP